MTTSINVATMTPSQKTALLEALTKDLGVKTTAVTGKITVETYTGKKSKRTSVKGFVRDSAHRSGACVSDHDAQALLKMEAAKPGSIMRWLQAIAGQQCSAFESFTF